MCELKVYKLSIGAACALEWPSERLVIQVLDDSTDPVVKVIDPSIPVHVRLYLFYILMILKSMIEAFVFARFASSYMRINSCLPCASSRGWRIAGLRTDSPLRGGGIRRPAGRSPAGRVGGRGSAYCLPCSVTV
jgi:hypothetical protein